MRGSTVDIADGYCCKEVAMFVISLAGVEHCRIR